MKANKINTFSRSGVEVTAMGFGAAPIGNIFRPIDESTSEAMIEKSWNAGIRYFDTAPMYGHGLSEVRVGHALRWKPRNEFTLSTKVGRILKPQAREKIDFTPWVNALPFEMQFDYSYDGTMRSIEDSIQRMGLERIDVAFIHDIDNFTHGKDAQPARFREAMDGAYKALSQLRDEGVVKSIGVGVNEWQVCHQALIERDFDSFLLAGRYTLLEQEALDEFLPLCESRGASIIIGGGFNSGILATGATEKAKYNYAPAPAEIKQKVAKIEAVCEEFNVALPAAALQFVLAHPCVPSIIPGTRDVSQLQQNLDWINQAIPTEFWETLKKQQLIREDAPTPND
ncbi:oxidoreductase, putative [Vibrio nigripulchritudo ATCC 27043]|uniref:aldo/keto reductase n=1 Tax=Vibrio TaxID=662 RepID=UPI00021C41D8|nr:MULTISPECIES: aldo/keto reductase [Vibrio]EGU57973.1 oxidoreductase, putative [Vibrio nigripulchritudo ATCC 27043]UAB73625.1 aldo/keto reductase [Vibrio sp. SCSIO 43132]CCN35068.1 Pyridoxal 4-dehydrogenase [Vibrio nigripulchritudo AM115]CCN40757.1 Pyridoxal 4-dehydrogenase [Vibrio nigripulchritudo FTn2]CCN64434.1 Pyridoxal 4-dehydrogenase [Vibrio nigripulchritudo POn4]